MLDRGQFAIGLHEVRLQIWHKNRPGGEKLLSFFKWKNCIFPAGHGRSCSDICSTLVQLQQILRGRVFFHQWTDGPRSLDACGPQDNQCNLITLTKHLKKMAMLDVLVLGIIVVVLSGSVYKEQGRNKTGTKEEIKHKLLQGVKVRCRIRA